MLTQFTHYYRTDKEEKIIITYLQELYLRATVCPKDTIKKSLSEDLLYSRECMLHRPNQLLIRYDKTSYAD